VELVSWPGTYRI